MQTLQSLTTVYVALTCVSSFAEELKLIQVLFRHGDRAPGYGERYFYPMDPYFNETWHPEGWGGLTDGGKRNARELGVFLKERYGEWLGNNYLEDEIVFRSSPMNRSIMTAEIVAIVLFPPSDIQRRDLGHDWQPIVVPSDHSTYQYLYAPSSECQQFLSLRRELEATDELLLNRSKELTEAFDFLSRNVGRKTEQRAAHIIYHQLYGELSENVELPEWTKGIFPYGELERIASYDYIIQSYNKTLIQLNGGQWIREWLTNVDSYLNGTRRENPRALFYAGHELNIAGVLVALGVFDQHVPFYCSTVMFELREVESQLYVKVLYRNRGILEELRIPGCGSLSCPLGTFRQLFADIITVDDNGIDCKLN